MVHAGPHALYVDVDGWCVGVLAPGAAEVPCALRTTGTALADLLAAGPPAAYLAAGTLRLDGRSLPIRRLVETQVPRVGADEVARCNTTGSVTAQATPPATVAGFVAACVPAGVIDDATVPRLIGRGPGLTPLGDDVLAGWLAAHRATGVPTAEVDRAIRRHAGRTTLLSATLLDCASHGEVLPEYAAWLRALGSDAEPERVRALHRVGATSGAGLHLGGLLALDQLARTPAVAA